MDFGTRTKNFFLLALCLFAVPVIAWLTTLYLAHDYENQFRNAVVNQSHILTAQEYESRGLHYLSFCKAARASGKSADVEKLCSEADEISEAQLASLATAGVGVILILLIFGARAIAGTSRTRMALVFGPLIRVVMLLLSLSVLAQAALFIYSFYTVEVTAIHRIHAGLIAALGVGALVACWQLLKGAFAFFKSTPMLLRAVELPRETHPKLYKFVEDIAAKLGASPPKQIVAGLEPNFFVTVSGINLLGSDRQLEGRTLFVSLGLMRMFSERELAAVVGHELGHFRGQDVEYSMKFAPTYRRLTESLQVLSISHGNAADLAKLPALMALVACWMEFATAERTVGRERELLADQAGASASDARSLATALLKVSLFGSSWNSVISANTDKLAEGEMYKNLSTFYAGLCDHLQKNMHWDEARQSLGETTQPHPVDTHPPLSVRLHSLRLSVEGFQAAELAVPEHTACELISNLDALEEELTLLEDRYLVAIGAVVVPDSSDKKAHPADSSG